MLIQTLVINNKSYQFKIGLKEIIYLQSISVLSEEDIFIAGITSSGSVSAEEAKLLFQFEIEQLPLLFEQVVSFLTVDVRDLYSKAVGEMGISPNIVLSMSPEEIDLAYIGYLRRQEMTANLNKLAFLQSLSGDKEPIKLLDKLEYTYGDLTERNNTFVELGIE